MFQSFFITLVDILRKGTFLLHLSIFPYLTFVNLSLSNVTHRVVLEVTVAGPSFLGNFSGTG